MSAEKLVAEVPKGLWAEAQRAAKALRSASKVVIASHIDADGVSAAALAATALQRAGVASEVRFFKKLDDEVHVPVIHSKGNQEGRARAAELRRPGKAVQLRVHVDHGSELGEEGLPASFLPRTIALRDMVVGDHAGESLQF